MLTDPYLPGHGDWRFTVEHYDLELDYKVATNHLSGTARLRCRALEDLGGIELDLYGLHVSRLRVDGRPTKYVHRSSRVRVPVVRPVGEVFTIEIAYAGKPRPMPGVHGAAGWEELTDGVLVGSQPQGAPSWYPCNDRSSDKASYAFRVRTEAGYSVVANGVLRARSDRAGRTTWEYDQAEPMASYLASVQIGRYAARALPAPVPVVIHAPPQVNVGLGSAFARQGEMVAAFTTLFGPYPYPSYAVVVTADPLEIPLEAQSFSSFGVNHAPPGWRNERLVAHELAHQWFGDCLTAAAWRDIWLHEGFACYAEWLWSEVSGGEPASAHAYSHHARLAALPQDLVLADPGPALMFDDRVYKRGALTLQALRLAVGDDAFFGLLRSWVAAHAHGSVSTADFLTHVTVTMGRPVPELDAWLFDPALPALPQVARG